ncbi:hypothetical protein HID58_053584 [Brassica napus]|uniref:Uncharacterized protein n=1 Tax=Brassica napus TaxID=3708 RepID=A0ABQ8AF53_BRANA|nr:hypothetical protein HID58_053584 [Brassica napus]
MKSIPVSLSTAPHSGNQNPPHPWLTTTSSSKPSFIHLPEKRSRVAMKASLSRTNEASLSAVISMLERERQGLTNGGGEQWHTAEDFCRRDKKTDEERRLRDMWHDWAGLTDPMDSVLRSELIRYGEMAQACYDAFDFNPSSRYCGNPCRVLASKCKTSPFGSDVDCWFDEALRTQAVLLEAGFLNIFERCLYGPGELEIEVSGSSSRFVVGFLCTELLLFPCSPVRRAVVLMNSGGLEKLSNGTEYISRSNAPTGLCTPHGNYGRKVLEELLLEQCWEPHTYVIKTDTQDKPGAKRLYGEEQASVISSKQLHHRTRFITMPVRIRSQIRRLCPFRVSALSLLP